MPRMRTWEAAIEILRETGNPRVMHGDERLLHMIANRMNRPGPGSWITSSRVLSALRRTPGNLVVRETKHRRHWVKVFCLPECSPDC